MVFDIQQIFSRRNFKCLETLEKKFQSKFGLNINPDCPFCTVTPVNVLLELYYFRHFQSNFCLVCGNGETPLPSSLILGQSQSYLGEILQESPTLTSHF